MAAKKKAAKAKKTVKRTGRRGPARFNARTQVEFLAGAIFTLKQQNEAHVAAIADLTTRVETLLAQANTPSRKLESLEDDLDLAKVQLAEHSRRFITLVNYLAKNLGLPSNLWDIEPVPAKAESTPEPTPEPVPTPESTPASPASTLLEF